MSRKSNPVSYKLANITRKQEIPHRIKQVRMIFANIRKQARAAYVDWRNLIAKGGFFKTITTDEVKKRTLGGLDEEAAKLEDAFLKAEAYCMEHVDPKNWLFDPEHLIADYNSRLRLINPYLNKPIKLLQDFQNRAYGAHRHESQGKKTEYTHKTIQTPFRPRLKFDLFKDVSKRYPFVGAKNKSRLARLFHAYFEAAGRFPRAEDIYPYMLVAAGIPAVEVVGPWWTRSSRIKSPMDWIRIQGTPSDGLGHLALFSRSPGPAKYVGGLGMDGSDGLLVEGVEHYWRQNKQVPSEHWVRRCSNELTEERTNAEIKDQIPDVEAWLGASQGWRRAKPPMVKIPPMPDPTFHVVAPSEAADLCRRAKRDGLCVIDVIQNQLMDEDPYGERPEDALDEDELELYKEDPVFARSKAEGVCTLIVSTDPQRRTVVGLNEEGKCTSEHHCTGKNNAVDKIAWEYFK